MPYPYRVNECMSERAPALAENAFWSCVLDRTRKESEWKSSREAEGRPKGAVESSGIMQLSMRDRDEEMSRRNRKECYQPFRTEARILSVFFRKNDLSLEFWGGDCHFVRESFNFEPAINEKSPRLIRDTERIHSHSETNDGNHWISDRTG